MIPKVFARFYRFAHVHLFAAALLAIGAGDTLAASSFTSCYTLENPATGDQVNTWGVTENTGRSITDQALAGVVSKSLAAGGTITLTDTQGAVSEAKNAEFIFTGVLPNATTVLWPNGRCRLFSATNNTTGAFSTTLCVNNGASACAGSSVVIPQGQTFGLYSDGTNIATLLNATPGAFTANGTLTVANGALNETSGTLASAGTVNIGAAAENYIIVTGTTTITAFDTAAAGVRRILKFSGILTLTNNASIILPGGGNISTAAGDVATFVSEGAGVWRCVVYMQASGIAGPTGPAGGDLGGNFPNPTVKKITAATGAINEIGVTLASASTVNLGAANGNLVNITGTTTITSFGPSVQAGTTRLLVFSGALTLTNGASLVLPNAANITTAANDWALFSDMGANVWQLVGYSRATGYPLKRSGTTAQVVNVETGAVATGTTTMNGNIDTIPTSSTGDQYMTLAVTPTNAGSTCIIDVVWRGTNDSGTTQTAALFQDATANALAAASQDIRATSAAATISFRHFMTCGTTSATTFKVRAGAVSAGTTTFNGATSARVLGGVSASSMTITEVLP